MIPGKILYAVPKDGKEKKHLEAVVKAFDSIYNGKKPNLFQTFTSGIDNTRAITFLTVDPQTHLDIGLLDEDTLWHFGQLMNSMFDPGVTEIILKKGIKDTKWFVTKGETDDMIRFTFNVIVP